MYGGQIQEVAPIVDLFEDAQHPYTQGLLRSIPNPKHKGEALEAIPATCLATNFPVGCRFATRCALADEQCHNVETLLVEPQCNAFRAVSQSGVSP